MKALAAFAACLAAASLAAPAAAITRLAPSQPAFHVPVPPPSFAHRGHFGRGDRELLWLGGYPGIYGAPEIVAAPPPAPIVNPPAPQVIYFSPVLNGAAPAPAPSEGPRIIYIGDHPTIRGPKVIYGVQ